MHSLNSRLAKLEQALKDKQQAQVNQSDAELMEAAMVRVAAMPTEQLLREYEAIKTAPFTDPAIAAEMQALQGLSDIELISAYMQKIKIKG